MKSIKVHLFLIALFSSSQISFAQLNWQKSLLSVQENATGKPENFYDIQKVFNEFWKDRNPAVEESENGPYGGYQQFKRWEWFMEPRVFPSGEFFDSEILWKEYKKEKQKQQRINIHPATTAANWSFVGPDVVPSNGGGAGRINVVRIDPSNPNKIFAGSANGGLWISTDGGLNWSTSTDFLPSLGIADIAINPRYTDTIFIATGDRDGYASGIPDHYTAGILVSGDGGQTWNQTSLSYVQSQTAMMFRLLINPDDPNILLAASNTAIFRSTDAGASWSNVRSGRVNDMEFKTDDVNTVFAASSSTLAVSTDAGATWTNRYTALAGSNLSLIAVTQANPNVIYFFSATGALKKSTDAGFSWTTMTSPSSIINMSQGWYDLALATSPADANIVMCAAGPNVSGGQGFARSTNGGSNWSQVGTGNHVDHHDLQFEPGNGNVVYNTNDGGIYKSINAGFTWTNISNGIDIKQYYRLGASALTSNYLYAGAQDNGTDRWKTGVWTRVGCCDGMDCLVDYTTDNIAFLSWQNGSFAKTTNGGSSFSNLTLPDGGAWVTPLIMHPLVHTTLYVGLSDVYKSVTGGTVWSAISFGLFGSAKITSLAISQTDPNYIAAAIPGKIYATRDGGTTWLNITTGLPVTSAGISGITYSSFDPLKMWVSLSGFAVGKKVYQTTDGGLTWTNISGTLPNIPANCITYQNNSQDALYLGTEFGVYYRDATMSDWISYNTGLPNVIIDELEIQYGSINKIRAATFGRGIWESDLNAPASYNLDAGVQNIVTPNSNPLCDNNFTPVITLKNYGQSTLTTVTINYQVDSDPVQVYTWNGSLAPNASTNVSLPAYTSSSGSHFFTVFTTNPNGSPDMNSFNDTRTVAFEIHSVPLAIPLVEGFESTSYPPANWTLEDIASATQLFTSAGGFGNSNNSFKAKGFTVTNTYANLVSYPVDLSSASSAQVSFSLAYAMQDVNSSESVSIYVSTNCGNSWSPVYSKTATMLATTSDHLGNFTPTASEWRTETVNISSFIGQSKVLVRFEVYVNSGNNIYIDDINISSPTGLQEINSQSISVYPNPVKGIVHFNLPNAKENTSIEFYSLTGSLVKSVKVNSALTAVNVSELSSGLYFYSVISESRKTINGKLMIE
jgi:photosystem II stability/assembly factor-like uncharacterized protein